MKKLHTLSILFILALSWFQGTAQLISEWTTPTIWDTNIPGLEVPPLIFTEFRGDNNSYYYVEVSNVGDVALDLGNFAIASIGTYAALQDADTDTTKSLRRDWTYIKLEGELGAGESYVLTNVFDAYSEAWDGLPRHNVAILDVADLILHHPENGVEEFLDRPEWEAYPFDSISNTYLFTFLSGSSGYFLEYKFTNDDGEPDSTIVDNVNISIDPYAFNGRGDQGNYHTPVAGVEDAIGSYILVRKSTITQGNVDWHLSRGTDLTTSEWLPVPAFYNKMEVFTTVGNHGAYNLDYTAKNPDVVTLDKDAKTLTVPWETSRDITLSKLFNVGANMSWSYTQNEITADSAFTNVRDGDIFSFYALSDTIKQVDLTIQVSNPTTDLAVAFAKRYQVTYYDEEAGDYDWFWSDYYTVTKGLDADSIYDIAFGTRVDTLFKYLYKPENAGWEILTGGEERADVHEGDTLRVTSENGQIMKDYILRVDDYMPSTNATLSMISWPDVNMDTYWQWASDTIPGFTPQGTSYFILLEDGTTNIPALQFKTANVNANYIVDRATNINGSLEQRTTTVTVTAEDGETTKTYKIEFQLQSVPTQPSYAEPFISELMVGMNFAYSVEIYNPGNQELDLGKYMLVRGAVNDNLGEAVSGGIKTGNNSLYTNYYVPGMRFKHDLDMTAYAAEPGLLTPDNTTNHVVQPGDVFVAGSINDGGWPGGRFYPSRYFEGYTDGSRHDFIYYGWSNEEADSDPKDAVNDQYNLNPWGLKLHRYYFPAYQNHNTSLFLVKILNEDVLNGTKPVTDPDDYEIVDRFQRALETDTFYVAGRNLASMPNSNSWTLTRKPHIWKGVTERGEGLGDNLGRSEENADWTIFNSRDSDHNNQDMIDGIGWHSMDPIVTFISTVTSTQFIVTKGYEGDLTITGSVDGLKVSEMTALLDVAHPDQTLTFMNGTTELTDDDVLADGMTLEVISADGKNTTIYTLVNSPLDTDNLLTAADGSGLTISLTDAVGSVSGVTLGTTISALLGDLIVPQTAVLNVVDESNNLLSMETMNYDSMMVDRVVGPNVFLEVVAENGDAAVYSLDFGLTDANAVLFSDILEISQDAMAVYDVPEGISVGGLLDLVYANANAVISIMDKMGFERTSGRLYSDDMIIVTSADNSVAAMYNLNFVTEVNKAPTASIDGPVEVVINEASSYTATVSDDGLPVGSTLTYLWEVSSGNAAAVTIANSDQATTDITFTETGAFEIRLTASDGELSTIVTTSVSSVVGIETFNKASIKVYPNPAKEVLYVEMDNKYEMAKVRIVDILGHVLFVNSNVTSNLEIGLKNFETGMYFLSIEVGDDISVHKVSITKN